jgi:hypothetical protein
MPQVANINTSASAVTNTGTANIASATSLTASNKAKSTLIKNNKANTFYERDGYASIEAEHFTRAVNTPAIKWQVIPNLGKTLSAVTPFPVTAASQTAGGNSARLEYEVTLKAESTVKVHTYLSPTLPFHNEGLRYAISIDDETPQVVDMHAGHTEGLWNKWVADNIIIKVTEHKITKPGTHTIKFWMVDPGVVLQKIVVDAGGLKPSYLGPEETKF